MALPKAKEDATAALLGTLQMPDCGGWCRAAREDALSRLTAMGLPHRRDEYWRFTDPASLIVPEVPKAATLGADPEPMFDQIERLRIVFVDGVFSPEQSDDLTLAGLEIERLSEAMTSDIHWARDIYGKLEVEAQSPVARPLAALNTAFASDGIVIRVTGKVEKPVSLVYLHERDDSQAILHHIVKVEAEASITILENGPAAARFNKAMEVDVADRGEFRHIRAQGRDHERRAATHLFGRLGQESVFKSFTLTVNGVMTRNECVLNLTGDDAVAHVAGAAVGDGDFHHDDTVFITHGGETCESRQVFKKVLKNGAVGVFQGKILVKDGAQKTDGYQISQALLLDETSQFLAKPELEIYADDVACSHGSTTGAIDEEALFYLRSRGVPDAEARDLLILAFLAEAIDEIDDTRIAEDLIGRLEGWLARRKDD
ncbi:Fe-S cluster assembly protein SufD [Mesobaculum littorinae]|uniref:Fe-S cluster assembly protein SufD n=1 Tax=Mesobaculum littorinae TaxID=2486419 RepID=A0A438AMB6_9RHOB|nr:Fe-S cluster assembly protein SufD [Mesobaculum littorinae]RVV99822.1 Fe-S cluster assembly protein SufD [Mesobaculum littorinae]